MGSEHVQPHVVLVPLPVQGHINPFTSLAHFLADAGISVTFVHSTRSHSLLSSSADDAPQGGRRSIRIAVMPEAESSGPSLSNFKDSIPIMCKGLEEILEKLRHEHNAPCCLISDKLLPWCHGVALKFGLPRIELFTSSASVLSIGMYIPEMIARGYVPATDKELQKKTVDFIPGLSPIRLADLPDSMKAANGFQDPAFQFISSAFEHSKSVDRILVNSMYELEGNVVEAWKTEGGGVRIDPVGPLFMMGTISTTESSGSSLLREDTSCLAWLDQQGESSVLFISFGSIATIEDDAFKELAHGVEASGESFLWVIRVDAQKDKTLEELLPGGFMERTKDRGLVISWAPQLAVLGHPSLGAFLTHCGWNSVLESLSNGIPMLGFPQQADQITVCKLIAHDWGVGFPLLEADANKIERTHVQRIVKAIMKGAEGTEARKRALEWRDIAHKAPHGTSKMNLQKLVDDLKNGHFKVSQ